MIAAPGSPGTAARAKAPLPRQRDLCPGARKQRQPFVSSGPFDTLTEFRDPSRADRKISPFFMRARHGINKAFSKNNLNNLLKPLAAGAGNDAMFRCDCFARSQCIALFILHLVARFTGQF
jgi:hypothetical protein